MTPNTPDQSPMARLRAFYAVPAKRGGRVEYTGGSSPQLGTILRAHGAQYLCIRLDGEELPRKFHPTWELRFLPEEELELGDDD